MERGPRTRPTHLSRRHFWKMRILCLLQILSCSALFGDYNVVVSDEGCFSCVAPNQTDILYTIDYASMCPDSSLWGVELTTAFVSRPRLFGWMFWQARTVAVRDSSGNIHHILLPFAINLGGESVLVGRAAIAILRRFGATATSEGSLNFCNLKVPLPLKSEPCVTQWSTPPPGAPDHDKGHSIRKLRIIWRCFLD